jgi:hypothetical protein
MEYTRGPEPRPPPAPVDLDADTVEALKLSREAQAAEREAWGPAHVDSGYVFTDESGQPLHAENVANRFDRLVRKARCRRSDSTTCATRTPRCCSRPASPCTSWPSAWATPSPALTLSIYSHVLPRQQSMAAAAFARLVDEPLCPRCGDPLDVRRACPSCGSVA